jgi:hypothetical protein
MKTFLNNFMGARRKIKALALDSFRATFSSTVTRVHEALGDTPFHLRAGLNAAAFDAVFVAFAQEKSAVPPDVRQRFKSLKNDEKFTAWVSGGTTDEHAIRGRLALAASTLFK